MRHLLIVLILLMGSMPDADAASRVRRFVNHGTGFDLVNGRETEVLECKYGDVYEQVPTLPRVVCFNVHGEMPLPEFFYIKWRDRTTEGAPHLSGGNRFHPRRWTRRSNRDWSSA